MERISNDINELRSSARAEIEKMEMGTDETLIAYFSEFPTIGSFPFKMALVQESDGRIRSSFRQWDTEYDLQRWSNGIYNLDRLRIITDQKRLNDSDRMNLMNWLQSMEKIQLPQSIHDEKAIILDGSDWEFGITLGINRMDYKWKAATVDIELFVPIIELMKSQHRFINNRH